MRLGISIAGSSPQPAPFWSAPVYLATAADGSGQHGPAAILDLREDRFALSEVPAGDVPLASMAALTALTARSFTDLVAFTRPGSATYVDAHGLLQVAAADQPRFDYTHGRRQLLLEGPATNLLLNSAGLATQSVTTSATTYTLSFYGTGTVTLTGASSGSLAGTGVNDRVSLTFTGTAGSLVLTVAGSVDNAQLETGAYPSSYIPTDGTTVTRPADKAQLTEPVAALLRGGAASVLLQGEGARNASAVDAGRFLSGSSSPLDYVGLLSPVGQIRIGRPDLTIADAVTSPLFPFGLGVSWDESSLRGSFSGGDVVSEPNTQSADFTVVNLGRAASSGFLNVWYDQLVIWLFRMTDEELQAKAVSYE